MGAEDLANEKRVLPVLTNQSPALPGRLKALLGPRKGGEQLEGRAPSLRLPDHLLEDVLAAHVPPDVHWLLVHLDPGHRGHDVQEAALTFKVFDKIICFSLP